jgi:4-hydroxy-tetrahydrodipicolinate reductase
MKIALLGYGKMGQVIERIALERGHEIVLKKDENNTFDGLSSADVAIDFQQLQLVTSPVVFMLMSL